MKVQMENADIFLSAVNISCQRNQLETPYFLRLFDAAYPISLPDRKLPCPPSFPFGKLFEVFLAFWACQSPCSFSICFVDVVVYPFWGICWWNLADTLLSLSLSCPFFVSSSVNSFFFIPPNSHLFSFSFLMSLSAFFEQFRIFLNPCRLVPS